MSSVGYLPLFMQFAFQRPQDHLAFARKQGWRIAQCSTISSRREFSRCDHLRLIYEVQLLSSSDVSSHKRFRQSAGAKPGVNENSVDNSLRSSPAHAFVAFLKHQLVGMITSSPWEGRFIFPTLRPVAGSADDLLVGNQHRPPERSKYICQKPNRGLQQPLIRGLLVCFLAVPANHFRPACQCRRRPDQSDYQRVRALPVCMMKGHPRRARRPNRHAGAWPGSAICARYVIRARHGAKGREPAL